MTETQEANDIALLDLLQAELEDSIFNYAVEETEDLYDEEEDVIVRALHWSVGTSKYVVVIHPLVFIKTLFAISGDEGEMGAPDDFVLQVTNTILSFTHDTYDYGKEADGK